MGQCGCSERILKSFLLPAPEGNFYRVELYPSCGYCSTPAGVTIDLHTSEDIKTFCWEDDEVKKFKPGYGNGEAIAVIGIEQLLDAVKKIIHSKIDEKITDEIEADMLAEEVILEDGLFKIVSATNKTFNE